MTKEKIIDAILNSKIAEIYDVHNYLIYADQCRTHEETILSVCSEGIIVIYDNGDLAYTYALTPFEEIAKIVILKEEILE